MRRVLAVIGLLAMASGGASAAADDELLGRARELFRPIPSRPAELPGNPATTAKVELGKMLFFDPRLSAEEKAGLALFLDKGCASCHRGVNLGGDRYAPFGVVQRPGHELLPPDDKGRLLVTKTPDDAYVFKVPSLRNVALTAPYFHSGSAWDLEQAVAVMGSSQLGVELTPEETRKVAAFLVSLTGRQPSIVLPVLPPSVRETPRPAR